MNNRRGTLPQTGLLLFHQFPLLYGIDGFDEPSLFAAFSQVSTGHKRDPCSLLPGNALPVSSVALLLLIMSVSAIVYGSVPLLTPALAICLGLGTAPQAGWFCAAYGNCSYHMFCSSCATGRRTVSRKQSCLTRMRLDFLPSFRTLCRIDGFDEPSVGRSVCCLLPCHQRGRRHRCVSLPGDALTVFTDGLLLLR